MHVIELLYCIGGTGPTHRIAGVTIDLSTDQVIRPIDYIRRCTACRCHLRPLPSPRRSSVEYNTVNPAMTCMTLTRDLQGRMKGMTCSPMMQMLTCMTINHQASHCGTMYTGLPISCSVPPSCSDCVGFHNFFLMTDYKQ